MATHKRVWKKKKKKRKAKEHIYHRGKWRNSSQNHPQQLQQYGIRTSCKATKKDRKRLNKYDKRTQAQLLPTARIIWVSDESGKGRMRMWERSEMNRFITNSIRRIKKKKRGMGMGKMIIREKKYTSTQIHTHTTWEAIEKSNLHSTYWSRSIQVQVSRRGRCGRVSENSKIT